MKILVTGGNGYIGSHTVIELLSAGHEVVIIDDLSNSKPYVHQKLEKLGNRKIPFYKTSVCDLKELEKVKKSIGKIDGIIHFAAHLLVEESVNNPLKYYQNNIVGLLNILKVFGENEACNFVFSSSCTVYGNPETLPITEKESIKRALNPYGNTKRMCEEILEDFAKTNDSFRALSLRYFNPIGAHDSGEVGLDPIGEQVHLVPILAEVALAKRGALKIFGGDYPTADGSCVRDYIHVMDLAQAHVKAISYLKKEKKNSPFEYLNVGSGCGFSVLEMKNAFEKVSSLTVPFEIVDRRAGDAAAVFADISLVKEKLDWQPVKKLEDMLHSAYFWSKKQNH